MSSVTTADITEVGEDVSPNKLYECPEEGCTAAFARNGKLINHMANGKHQRQPERHSMRDYAMQTYYSKLVPVQIRYLTDKFDQGLKEKIRWKPEGVAAEMQQKKRSDGKFLFSSAEFLKTGQIRSFFSRLKNTRGKLGAVQEIDEEDNDEFKDDQVMSEVA
ncbi:unnamed protein product [Didymodactylos carnosus]|uniref:C2H2-type domain-containing protein n=1 Tax=Didymodactylos carnosus TaxID=1234261 RepID=A0A8S2X2U7_9BILA|nr:unnamed protein product [Didymodactylos carnosus]